MNRLLWFVQGLLAALFLFAGGTKLVLPPEALAGPVPLPTLFLRFIGICEILGAVGLVVPWLVGIRPILTPLAGAGLTVIMIGALLVSLVGEPILLALVPLITGLLTAFVAYGRWPATGSGGSPGS
jgi:hypothetical protein